MSFPRTEYTFAMQTFFESYMKRVMSVTTYWSVGTEPSDVLAKQGCVDAFDTAFKAVLQPVISDDSKITTTRGIYRDMSTTQEEYWAANDEVHGSGDPIGDAPVPNESNDLPEQDALVIQRITGIAGRDSRGRIFIPCIAEAIQAAGRIDDGDKPKIKAVATFLGADVVAGTQTLHARHWNRKLNTLQVVTLCRAMIDLKSRRDRQRRGVNMPA